MQSMTERVAALNAFFAANPKAALAFSGGVDSAFLLFAAARAGCDVTPYYVKTQFQPAFELADAKRLAAELGLPLRIVALDVLAEDAVRENPENRCYFCKRALFGALAEAARQAGNELILDGTNASDDAADRPGMRALQEMRVRSPLREAGLTKTDIRALSKEAGLFTWNKPAYACLATRVEAGTPLEEATLRRVERAEDALRALGFSDLRARVYGGAARLQVRAEQMPLVIQKREEIRAALSGDFAAVLLDLKAR